MIHVFIDICTYEYVYIYIYRERCVYTFFGLFWLFSPLLLCLLQWSYICCAGVVDWKLMVVSRWFH